MISAVPSTPAWGMQNPMTGSAAQRHKEMFDQKFTRSMMRGVSAYDGKAKQRVGGTGGVVDATM